MLVTILTITSDNAKRGWNILTAARRAFIELIGRLITRVHKFFRAPPRDSGRLTARCSLIAFQPRRKLLPPGSIFVSRDIPRLTRLLTTRFFTRVAT